MNTIGTSDGHSQHPPRDTGTTHPSTGGRPSRVTLTDACQASSCIISGGSELIPMGRYLPPLSSLQLGQGSLSSPLREVWLWPWGSVVNNLQALQSGAQYLTLGSSGSSGCSQVWKEMWWTGIHHKAASIFCGSSAQFQDGLSPLQKWLRI